MRLQAPHCPSCGAPVPVPTGAARVDCAYCGATLVVHAERISAHRPAPPPPKPEEPPLLEEPDAALFTHETARFELSVVEQVVPGVVDDVFTWLELPKGLFAFASLRAVEADKQAPVKVDLAPALAALKESLEGDADPGLAANLALEALCAKGFAHQLEVAVLLFDPSRMKVTPYAASRDSGAMWVSSEEGRPITLDHHRQALERKLLREQGSHFENGRAIHLAAQDLVVLPSPAVLNRGGTYSGNFAHDCWETAREHLGEAPLRVVTLLKNAFWAELQRRREDQRAPVGHVRVAAVRAILPPVKPGLPPHRLVELVSTPAFELAALLAPSDRLTLVPLHGERHVLVLVSPKHGALADAKAQAALDAIRAVLDRKDHGDNENPRQAGRDAYAAMGVTEEDVALAVVQTLDRHGRVKYFRAGFKQPVALGPRGVRDGDVMQFDEGGEATVRTGARLFFPGTLPFDGQANSGPQLAEAWPGGKASRLYDALVDHWKTKKTDRALEKLTVAALSDVEAPAVRGLLLVTGKKE